MTSLIAALTKDRVIGSGNAIPWRIPEDVRLFKERTMGHPVIMGRRTWDSIPAKYRPLPGRRNIVISAHMPPVLGIDVCRSLDDALTIAATYTSEPFIAGGARVYAEALARDLVDTMLLTWVDGHYSGDAFFPEVDWTRWREKERMAFNDATFIRYEREGAHARR